MDDLGTAVAGGAGEDVSAAREPVVLILPLYNVSGAQRREMIWAARRMFAPAPVCIESETWIDPSSPYYTGTDGKPQKVKP